MKQLNLIVATVKDWNIDQYQQYSQIIKANWHLITSKDDLTLERVQKINPDYIFFPHWSWIVPKEITANYNCVCFHMTDLPYGRGGSPLQNLIIRGHKTTKITALKMTNTLDAGDIYLKHPLALLGSAQEIFTQASVIVADMIKKIVEQNPKPVPQTGEVVEFSRRIPTQSLMPNTTNLEEVYNHIRMLDAPDYPMAYMKHKNIHLIFNNANMINGVLTANVKIEVVDE